MSNWQKNLTKRELSHLSTTCPPGQKPTLRSLKNNLAAQRAYGITCFECIQIARKLGLEP